MLQQTTVAAVKPFYLRFLDRFPTVEALADGPVDQVMQAWAGLGYYSRARNLHACAKAVVERLGGGFPATEAELLTLPASAPIRRRQSPPSRSTSRRRRWTAMWSASSRAFSSSRSRCRRRSRRSGRSPLDLVPPDRPGDFAQAVMDLGATICTPKSPACALCPWMDALPGAGRGDAGTLPEKAEEAHRRPAPRRRLRGLACG